MSAAESDVIEKSPDLVAIVAAMVDGDRWLCADAGAAYLGQMPRKTFLEFAAKSGFPVPTRIGKRRVWRKSELDEWAERLRANQQRQKAA